MKEQIFKIFFLLAMFFMIAGNANAAAEKIGRGCTTVYYIDKDCDGYGVGKKASDVYPLGETDAASGPYTVPTGDMQDADDNDQEVNTTVSWQAKWGSDNAGMVNFLEQRKNFSNTSRIFYLSQNGDNATAVINDPNRPYRTMAPILTILHDLQGGAIIVRGGGLWTDLDFKACTNGNPCYNLTGTSTKPVYVLAYPGEKVETNVAASSQGIVYWPVKSLGYVTYDGIIWRSPNYHLGNGLAFIDSDHLTFRNIELAGWMQTLFGNHTEDLLFEDSVCHDMAEHCVYANSSGMTSYGAADFDFADDAIKYANGTSPGASYRPKILNNVMYNNGAAGYEPIHINTYVTGVQVKGNIVSYGGGTGLGLQSGVYNSVISNNLFFDNGRSGITLSLYGPDTQAATLRWNTIENNTIWVGKHTDSIRSTTPSNGIVLNDYSSADGHWIKDITIRNNIIVTDNYDPTWGSVAFYFDRNSFPDSDIIESNVIWSSAQGASNADRTMVITKDAYPDGHDEGGYNFSAFGQYSSNFRSNIYSDPLFTSASQSFTITPEKFIFDLLSGSAAIDAGVVTGAPLDDLRGVQRANLPDIGAYEYVLQSSDVIAPAAPSGLSVQ
jgi:hypothetical protein